MPLYCPRPPPFFHPSPPRLRYKSEFDAGILCFFFFSFFFFVYRGNSSDKYFASRLFNNDVAQRFERGEREESRNYDQI